MPLKFGPETLTHATCARVKVRVTDASGRSAEGWGETPLSVQWVWPSSLPYEKRHAALKEFTIRLAAAWAKFESRGHPVEIGYDFQEHALGKLWQQFNEERAIGGGAARSHNSSGLQRSGDEPSPPRAPEAEPMPWLAALVCCSLFDLAIHDAFGNLVGRPTYETYGADFCNRTLADLIEPARDADVSFRNKYIADFLSAERANSLPAWHLVAGLDPLDKSELTGAEPDDGYPILLRDWIERDGLRCLKIKLRGNDVAWDCARTLKVGKIALETGVADLTADFNCTVKDPAYVNEVLDRVKVDAPEIFEKILYVEQPFPYELEQHRIDVHSVSKRRPLFLDESAHDWKLIRLGHELGWTGVALKTCKTQTGALLSACWARAHGMELMVQDLTNPMMAQITHVLLAAYVGTIRGVETNSMQFYPDASIPEEKVHPGIYRRRNGQVDLSSVCGVGFGYRLEEMNRILSEPIARF